MEIEENIYSMAMEETLSVFGLPIPPSKVADLARGIRDTNSLNYQEKTWNLLEMVIDDLVRDVNLSNLKQVVAELLAENIIRGRGMFCKSCMKYQLLFPEKTIVYAALACLVNRHFPAVGSLLIRRLYKQFTLLQDKTYDHDAMLAVMKFMAHLINFQVLHYMNSDSIIMCCLQKKTPEYVLCAVEFFKEFNLELSYAHEYFKGVRENFSVIVHEGMLDQDILYAIEALLSIWDSKFVKHPSVYPELEFLKKEYGRMHSLDRKYRVKMNIFRDKFKPDALFLELETGYETCRRVVLHEGYWRRNVWKDNNLEWRICMRAIWTDDFPVSCGNRLLQSSQVGGEMQLCLVLLEECVIEDDFSKLLPVAEYLCANSERYQMSLTKCFVLVWLMIPGLSGSSASILAQFFAKLLANDVISWHILACLQFAPEAVTTDQISYLKEIFMVLKIHLTEEGLLMKLSDPSLEDVMQALFPKDDPGSIRFAFKLFKKMRMYRFVKGIKEKIRISG